MTKLKKSISLLLTVFILFLYVAYPALSFAQEASPTDTPTPTPVTTDNSTVTPTPTINPSATPMDTPTPTPTINPSISPTDTSTDTPTPTIDPSATPTDSPTPTDTPTPTTDISNNAIVNNNGQSDANSGDNSIIATGDATIDDATPSGSDDSVANSPDSSSGSNPDSSSPTSTINTGSATSSTSIVNDVNTNSINSSVVNQTLNIFVAQNGDLNLSDPFTIAATAISAHPLDSVINVSVTNVNNFAYITNDVASAALTGENLISTADQSAAITTGNAFSAVSLLNKVNFTVINSQIHLVTINIFGNLNGNIILPDPNASTDCTGCGVNLNTNNTAVVSNNLSSTADTGNNSIIASGSATISTGDAQSVVNSLNIVNTNVLGASAEILYINDLGTWNGNFIGWGNFDPTSGGASLVLYNLSPNGSGGNGDPTALTGTNINNAAIVQNNVSSLASSGGNSITGGNSSISTGNSFSAISLMNFINANFINSFGFFGFINIFGNWTGNIGGVREFAALNAQNNNSSDTPPVSDAVTNGNSTTTQEQGGSLSVDNSNNVGAFVYPGDTVTFFIKVKNTGTGKVYGTTLTLTLMHNGQNMGTASFNIGDIEAQQGGTVTTGIVLPKNTPGGLYTAVAQASGNVGPNNTGVSASANSTFNVFNNATLGYNNGQTPHVTVLGAQNKTGKESLAAKNARDYSYLFSLILILMTYVLIRGIRKRRYLINLFSSADFKAQLASLRMFLF